MRALPADISARALQAALAIIVMTIPLFSLVCLSPGA
jgi:hypothetical protein